MSRFSPHNPSQPFARTGVPSVDFAAAFGDFWRGSPDLAAAFPGGLFDGPARNSTPLPLAIATYLEPERGETLEDSVFEVNLACYAIKDAEARRVMKVASGAILKTRSRPRMTFFYEDSSWMEYSALRSGGTTLALAATIDDGSRVWACEQRFRFSAVATSPVRVG